MIIEIPGAGDLPGLKEVWQEAFGDREDFVDGFFATGFSPDRCRCVRMGDRPVTVLYWFDCFLEDKKLAYIYAVATDKAYRGRGLCRKLMEQTHRQLKTQGYSAAVLVPGNKKLFSMYGALGYTPFCPMETTTLTGDTPPVPVEKITAAEYFQLRGRHLPPKGILQAAAAGYLETFAEFYKTEGALMCLSKEGETLYFQEFLGDPTVLPGVVCGLGAKKAVVRLPGGKEYAMYLPLSPTDLTDAYLGISLG